MIFVGAQPNAGVRGIDELPGKSHYFVGRVASAWRRNVLHYSRVRYTGLYPGIDVEF